MTASPTPEERAALRVAEAALVTADSSYGFASAIVFALGAAQLLQSPRRAAELQARRNEDLSLRAELAPTGAPRAVPFELGESLLPAVQWLIAKVAERGEQVERLRARVAELETFARGCDGEGCVLPHSSWCTSAREFAATHGGCTCGEPWKDTPQSHAGHCWLLSPPDDELEWHRKRVAELLVRVDELEAERHVTNEALSDAAVRLRQDRDRIAELETARGRLAEAMQRGQHWRDGRLVSERTFAQREIRDLTGIPLRESTADEYRYCGADLGRTEFPFTCYRRVAHDGPCSPEPDPGFYTAAERAEAAAASAPGRALLEDPHDSPLHHGYRLGRDLPEYPVTPARGDQPALAHQEEQ